jgi:hypothetical protein
MQKKAAHHLQIKPREIRFARTDRKRRSPHLLQNTASHAKKKWKNRQHAKDMAERRARRGEAGIGIKIKQKQE